MNGGIRNMKKKKSRNGVFQSFNPRTDAWVKYKVEGGRSKILNVKQKDPAKPFKGVKIKG